MWAIFVFTAIKSVIPQYVIVFIMADKIGTIKNTFKSKIGYDPETEGYEYLVDSSQIYVWEKAKRKGLVSGTFSLSEVEKLPEVKTIRCNKPIISSEKTIADIDMTQFIKHLKVLQNY